MTWRLETICNIEKENRIEGRKREGDMVKEKGNSFPSPFFPFPSS